MMEIVQDETFKTKQDIQNYFFQLKKQVKRFTDDILYLGFVVGGEGGWTPLSFESHLIHQTFQAISPIHRPILPQIQLADDA